MNNIVGNHITNVQENFRKYNTLVLKNKYDKKISDELIQTYIDARYYNYGLDNNIKFFYRRIYGALMKKGNELIKKSPRRKELIDNMVALFQYYFYFDNVRNNVGIDEIVASIAEKRIFKLNLKTAIKENFEESFSEIVKEYIKRNVFELTILIAWVVSIIMESKGGRAQWASSRNLFNLPIKETLFNFIESIKCIRQFFGLECL